MANNQCNSNRQLRAMEVEKNPREFITLRNSLIFQRRCAISERWEARNMLIKPQRSERIKNDKFLFILCCLRRIKNNELLKLFFFFVLCRGSGSKFHKRYICLIIFMPFEMLEWNEMGTEKGILREMITERKPQNLILNIYAVYFEGFKYTSGSEELRHRANEENPQRSH